MRAHNRIFITAALVAGALAPATAGAQSACPTPTIVQCRDPGYLQTACGQQATATDASSCTVQLRAAYQTEVQRPDVQVQPVMLPGQPGVTGPAGVKRYNFYNHLASSFDGEFMGTEQRSQLWNGAGRAALVFTNHQTVVALTSVEADRQAWAANGAAVQSCREMAYERYYGFTSFKDQADTELLSDEAFFARAMDPANGIANRALYSRSGQSVLPAVTFPSNGVVGTVVVGGQVQQLVDPRSPKNGFFKAYKSLARGSFFGPSTVAIRTKLQAGLSHHVVDWSWHTQMQSALSGYDGETLRHYEDLQADFLRLTAQRDSVLALIAKFGSTMTSSDQCAGQPGCVPTTRNLAAELSAIEAALWAELNEADAQGCLDMSGPTKCDWSYRQLRDQVAAYYSKLMEASYQTCVTNTADDFSPAASIHHANAIYGAPKADYAAAAEDVEKFGDVVKTWAAAQQFPTDPVSGKPFMGERKSDHGTLGSGDMSLDWSYDTGWAVTDLTKAGQSCQAGFSVDGAFAATGHAFGTTVNVIDAKAKLSAAQQVGKAQVKLMVLDQKIWDRWDNPYTTELSAGLVKDMKSGTSKEFSTTVYPFGIPVTLGAGVGMSVGLKVNAKAAVGGSCTSSPNGVTIDLATVQGSVTPWAQADGFASAAVGIPGFRAGIKCNLVLVRGEMPITADAKIQMTPQKAITASISLTGREKFRMLDGNLKAFVDGPFDFLDSEWTIFAWQGPTIDQQIFDFSKSNLPLDAIKTAL